METNTNLKELCLSGSNIGAEGAKALAKALVKNTNLTVLKLSNNDIGDDGAEALAKALAKNTNLKELCLSSSNIGAEGAKALAKAFEKNANLTEIDLLNNGGIEEQTLIDIKRMRLRNIRLVSPEEVTNRKKISERFADKLGLLPELGPEITAFLYPIDTLDTHENLSFVAKVKREKEEPSAAGAILATMNDSAKFLQRLTGTISAISEVKREKRKSDEKGGNNTGRRTKQRTDQKEPGSQR